MNARKKRLLWKTGYLCVTILLIIIFAGMLHKEENNAKTSFKEKLAVIVFENALYQKFPVFDFLDHAEEKNFWENTLVQFSPLYFYMIQNRQSDDWKESKIIVEEIENFEVISSKVQKNERKNTEKDKAPQNIKSEKIEKPVRAEQLQEEKKETQKPETVFSIQQLQDVEFVKKTFFTVDPTTSINSKRLSYEKLMEYDASIKKNENNAPEILIYHTHSQENFVDSVPFDVDTSIVGVGENLACILREKYGYHVLHHLGEYDKESRDYAYSYAAKGLAQVLKDNPSIEVIIDLHRDAVKENTRLVTTIDGKKTARFMFFNGMSYTNALGSLNSLPNPYIQENISFAFQLKLLADEYYPGLTRKTYLKGYRYNMQYRPKSLLIEVGAQNNTVKEAYNACEPLAHLLSLVLSGSNRQ